MFRSFVLGALVVVAAAWGCSGSGSDNGGAGAGGTAGSGGVAGSGGTAGTGGGGGDAGAGGEAGTSGAGGSSFVITPGPWSYWAAGTAVCFYVNEDSSALIADETCSQNGIGLASWAFEFRTNRQEGCGMAYPLEGDDPQEIPIVDNQFEIEATRGEATIRFSGTFTGSDSATGTASSTMGCPEDVNWSASSGLCSRCW